MTERERRLSTQYGAASAAALILGTIAFENQQTVARAHGVGPAEAKEIMTAAHDAQEATAKLQDTLTGILDAPKV